MDTKHQLLASNERFSILTGKIEPDETHVRTLTTRDHDEIRRWAAQRRAEPATGEATRSGPATVNLNDGGAGIRFNFPGVGRFRPITWQEWFENFERYELTFVYEEEDSTDVALRAYELWDARGRTDGHDLEDWLLAERQLRGSAGARAGARYRLVKIDGAWFDSLP